MKETIFTGAAVALVTPFNPDMSVNYEELEKLIEFQITSGTDAIVTCGTTGEAATLTDEEHVKVIEFTVNKAVSYTHLDPAEKSQNPSPLPHVRAKPRAFKRRGRVG